MMAMYRASASRIVLVVMTAAVGSSRAGAQPQSIAIPPGPGGVSMAPHRLTLDEARHRVMANNKLIQLAALNIQSKGHATSAARADFFPKIVGNTVYLHFSDPLGTVLTTPGLPRLGVSPRTRAVNVLNQDTSFTSILAVQPITDLLKVRQGVKLAKADEQIAQAQLEKGTRELLNGVDQLYWGLLASLKIRDGVLAALQGAEQLAKSGMVEGKLALVETRQALQQVNAQAADIQEQLNILLDLPPSTPLDLIEPPMPGPPVSCAEDAVRLALAASPDIREAAQNIAKAEAATCAAKLDYVPSIAATGGYTNQTGMSYVQQNFGYVGVFGTYTFVDFGKRRNVVREREHLVSMATLKLRQTQDDVRQKALKAYRGLFEAQEALNLAGEMAGLRREAEASAMASAATNPSAFLDASKARSTAEVDYVKADLAYRQAHGEFRTLIGR